MESLIKILSVEQDGRDGIIVAFSDGTTGEYVVEELLELRPKRGWTMQTETARQGSTSAPGHNQFLNRPNVIRKSRLHGGCHA